METIEYTVEDHLATITLNRPDKHNAINRQMRLELWDALNDIRSNEEAWVVLLRGNGPSFCSGHDLSEPASLGPGPTSYDLFTLQNQIYKPFIVAMHGVCAAQGGGMAMLSDIRVAGSDVRLGWPQVKLGITSVSGPTMFARFVPQNKALEYLMTGEFLKPEEALRLGLFNYLVEPHEVLPKATELASKILKNAPLAVAAMKEIVVRTKHLPDDQAFRFARLIYDTIEQTEDAKAGIEAFHQKTKAEWKRR